MTEVDHSRYFRNVFPDYDPASPDPEIIIQSGLSGDFLKRLRLNRNKLLKRHYQEYSRIRDEDYSVYTGKILLSSLMQQQRISFCYSWLLMGCRVQCTTQYPVIRTIDLDDHDKINDSSIDPSALPSCGPGFESQVQHIRLGFFNLNPKRREINSNKKSPGLSHFFKKKLFQKFSKFRPYSFMQCH